MAAELPETRGTNNRCVGVRCFGKGVPVLQGTLACQNMMCTQITATSCAATGEKTAQHIFSGRGTKSEEPEKPRGGSSQTALYRFPRLSSPRTLCEGDRPAPVPLPGGGLHGFVLLPFCALVLDHSFLCQHVPFVCVCLPARSKVCQREEAQATCSICGLSEIAAAAFWGRELAHKYLQRC